MYAIGCDGTFSQGLDGELICDGPFVLLGGPWLDVESGLEVAGMILLLMVTAFGIRLLRRAIWGKG